ncbi:MAG: class II glutamine amidotransferase [Endomicrobiales bacterium]|jgi:glutamine amidotransferase
MCRLFGIKNFDSSSHKRILQDFFELAEKGNVLPGEPPGHVDGWGIGWYQGGTAHIEKSGSSALSEAEKINSLVHSIGSTTILIAHLRNSAWHDTSTSRHAHPFGLNNIIFAHNGTVIDYHPLRNMIPQELLPPLDSLDTEVLFRAVMSSPESALKEKFIETIKKVKMLKYSALNVLMSDGNSLFGYRDYAQNPDYYTLYSTKINNSTIICSEKLPASNEWVSLNNEQLIVV